MTYSYALKKEADGTTSILHLRPGPCGRFFVHGPRTVTRCPFCGDRFNYQEESARYINGLDFSGDIPRN